MQAVVRGVRWGRAALAAVVLVAAACADRQPDTAAQAIEERRVLEAAVQAELLAERMLSGVNRLLLAGFTRPFPPMSLASLGGPQSFGPSYAAVAQAVTDWNSRNLEQQEIAPPPVRVPVVLTTAESLTEIGGDAVGARAWSALPTTSPTALPLTGVFHLSRVGFDAERTVAVVALERRPGPDQAVGELALMVRRPGGWRKLRTLHRWG